MDDINLSIVHKFKDKFVFDLTHLMMYYYPTQYIASASNKRCPRQMETAISQISLRVRIDSHCYSKYCVKYQWCVNVS